MFQLNPNIYYELIQWTYWMSLAIISTMGETFCSNYCNCLIVDGVVMSTKATMLDFPIELVKEID
jgi:hypothetical protein